MRVLRRGEDDFLLLTEPELGETLRDQLLRMRFAAKAEIELEEHTSTLVFGGGAERDSERGLRRARRRGAGRRARADARRGCARGPADRGGDAALRQGDRRPRPSCRGGARRAGRQPDEGLLSGPGADRPPPLPRPREPRAARARRRGRGASRARRRAELRGEGRGQGDERRSGERRHRRARLRARRGPAGCRARRWVGRKPGRYTDPRPRARSSGDRALPCGGRGRTFESCRAHFAMRA